MDHMQHSDVTVSASSSDCQQNAGQSAAGKSPSRVARDTCSVDDDTHSTAVTESSGIMWSSSDVLCYHSVDESTNIDEHVVDFLLSLFWVLESKRRDRSCEHVDNLTLLTAPFEHRKDSSSADLDGRLLNFPLYLITFILYVHDVEYRTCSCRALENN